MSRVLVINPGSTSSKIAVYDDLEPLVSRSIRHEKESAEFPQIMEQLPFRRRLILQFLAEEGLGIGDLDAIIARGGLLRPLEGGTYPVNEHMLADLRSGRYGEHASNLGAILATELRESYDIPALIADPVVVDELIEEARYSGWPDMPRVSIFHALNQKAVAKRFARETGRKYEELRLIISHMGGGLSVGAHRAGKVIDVNNALDGDGPFSAERTGGLPLRGVLDCCFSGEHTREELQRLFIGRGGLFAYLGSKDGLEITRRIREGDAKAEMAIRAMAYQVAKEIGALAAVLNGKVDAILLTGGMAYMDFLCRLIEERVSFIADVKRYAGEDEMGALALAAWELLHCESEAKEY